QPQQPHEPVTTGNGEAASPTLKKPARKPQPRPAGEDEEPTEADEEIPPVDRAADEDEGEGEAKTDDEIDGPEEWAPPVIHERGPVEAFLALDLLWQVLLGLGVFCLILSMLAVSLTKSHTPPRETLAYVVLAVGGPILVVGTFWFWGRVFNESIL